MARKRSAEGTIEHRNALGRRRKDAMFPVAPPRRGAGLPSGYAGILRDLKGRIQQERLRTVMAANSAMVLLYAQSQVHENIRRGLAGPGNCARGACTNHSDMAAQVFKDPYLFDFLGTADPRREREFR